MLHEFTVTQLDIEFSSLPLPNQNFPKTTNHIPGLFNDFQGPEASTFKFKYFPELSRTWGTLPVW